MCGRFIQLSAPEIYESTFDLDEIVESVPHYNIAPTQPVLVIRATADGRRTLAALRWGLVPPWSKGPDSRYSLFNARAETVDSKPAFRNAFRHRRCLVPAEGFYEWEPTPTGKQPYLIRRWDRQPFAIAGLWEIAPDTEGKPLESCTLIVTEANPLIRPVHDRMPVILGAEARARWLDPDHTDVRSLRALLATPDAEELELFPLNQPVGSPENLHN